MLQTVIDMMLEKIRRECYEPHGNRFFFGQSAQFYLHGGTIVLLLLFSIPFSFIGARLLTPVFDVSQIASPIASYYAESFMYISKPEQVPLSHADIEIDVDTDIDTYIEALADAAVATGIYHGDVHRIMKDRLHSYFNLHFQFGTVCPVQRVPKSHISCLVLSYIEKCCSNSFSLALKELSALGNELGIQSVVKHRLLMSEISKLFLYYSAWGLFALLMVSNSLVLHRPRLWVYNPLKLFCLCTLTYFFIAKKPMVSTSSRNVWILSAIL